MLSSRISKLVGRDLVQHPGIPEARNARWIRKRFKKEKKHGPRWAGEEVDLLSDGFHSSGGVSAFPSNPITTVKCDLGSWPYAAHHETPWAFRISSGPDTNRGAPGILSLQPAAAMGVFRTVEGIKFSKRAPIPRREEPDSLSRKWRRGPKRSIFSKEKIFTRRLVNAPLSTFATFDETSPYETCIYNFLSVQTKEFLRCCPIGRRRGRKAAVFELRPCTLYLVRGHGVHQDQALSIFAIPAIM